MRATGALTVRSADLDTPLADEVRIWRGLRTDLVNASRVIILIHGFQNGPTKAHRSYEQFQTALSTASWQADLGAIGSFWEFHWPGDHPNKPVSIGTYAVRIPDARASGERLARFIEADLSPRQDVCLVAHSLGCRVAMETLRSIFLRGAAYRGPHVTHTFLLAAAVPSDACRRGHRLGVDKIPVQPDVFHSTSDRALSRLSFEAGQWVYAPTEASQAVGIVGAPDGRWSASVATGHRHKEYWPSYVVAEHIGRQLGLLVQRTLRSVQPSAWYLDDDLWSAFDEHELPEAEIPERH